MFFQGKPAFRAHTKMWTNSRDFRKPESGRVAGQATDQLGGSAESRRKLEAVGQCQIRSRNKFRNRSRNSTGDRSSGQSQTRSQGIRRADKAPNEKVPRPDAVARAVRRPTEKRADRSEEKQEKAESLYLSSDSSENRLVRTSLKAFLLGHYERFHLIENYGQNYQINHRFDAKPNRQSYRRPIVGRISRLFSQFVGLCSCLLFCLCGQFFCLSGQCLRWSLRQAILRSSSVLSRTYRLFCLTEHNHPTAYQLHRSPSNQTYNQSSNATYRLPTDSIAAHHGPACDQSAVPSQPFANHSSSINNPSFSPPIANHPPLTRSPYTGHRSAFSGNPPAAHSFACHQYAIETAETCRRCTHQLSNSNRTNSNRTNVFNLRTFARCLLPSLLCVLLLPNHQVNGQAPANPETPFGEYQPPVCFYL